MAPDWAEALRPVEDRGSPSWASSCAPRSPPAAATCRRATNVLRAFRQPMAGRARADRRPGPLPDARPPGRAELLGRARRPAAARQPGEHLQGVRGRPRLPAPVDRRPEPVERARGDAAEPGAHRAARLARLASRQGLGAGHRAGHPAPWPRAAGRWSRSCGETTRATWRRCSAACPASSPRTRARCRPTAASSAHARSAGRTSCCRSRAASRSTGSCPNPPPPIAAAPAARA